MNDQDDLKLPLVIRAAMPPLGTTGPSRDLWSLMLQRLDRASVSIHWLDWLVAALGALCLLLLPEAIPGILYQL